MDNTFQLLDEAGRVDFFRLIMQSIGYSYICLWSYFRHPYNCLSFLDGFFYEENNQPSSSSGSKARRLFDEYRQAAFIVENERVPGFAFKNSLPYVEIQELELQKLTSTEAQRQFYQEARIKKAIFMGCRSGEIEIGFANVSQVDIEKEMRSFFPRDFSPQLCPIREPFWLPDQINPPSSSSSISLRSPSTDSPEYSSLLFNIPSNAHFPETPREVPSFLQIPTTPSPYQEAMQAFARARNIRFPTPETENAAVARAFLAVLSSTPSSSLSHQPQQDNLPYNHRVISKSSAFKSYVSALRPTTQMRANLGRQSMVKRSIAFVRSLNSLRVQDQHLQATRLSSTQLHHMISERKRREKLNESFQALRSLLPSGTKKDKASLLATAREYLSSLKSQIAELTRRNQLLMAQLLPAKETINVEETSSSNERLGIRIIPHVLDSTIEERRVELRVTVRGECPMEDMLIRILEFLEQVENVSLVSMESSTGQMIELISSTRISLALRIEVNELWDEAGFLEAVRRVIADLAP